MSRFKKTQPQPRTRFTYTYQGYKIDLKPIGLRYERLGKFAAHCELSHSQEMALPYELKYSAYGSDIGDVCARAERNLDKCIEFFQKDASRKEEGNQRLREFADVDRRFQ